LASLPVSAKTYFKDFAFDLVNYDIERNSNIIATLQGLSNKDEGGKHIAFLLPCDIQIGDVLIHEKSRLLVKNIEVDTYNGRPELLKAYY